MDKFYLRKNFAIGLTKKKEVLYWGDIIENKRNSKGNEDGMRIFQPQFIDLISQNSSVEGNQHEEYQGDDSTYKKSLLCKRLPGKL